MLVSFVGGRGHLDPMLPIVDAVRDVGHEIEIAGSGRALTAAARLGYRTVETVVASQRTGAEVNAPGARGTGTLAVPDRGRDAWELAELFVRRAGAARAPVIAEHCRALQPDIVLCDEVDVGAMLAAELTGRPHATVAVTAAGSFVRPEVVGPALDEVRAGLGLPPDPTAAMLHRYLTLMPFPPSFHDAGVVRPTSHTIRPELAPLTSPVPDWLAARGPGDRPLVYATLGTDFNTESGDLFDRLIAGLAALEADGVDGVVTVGGDLEPAVFGPAPTNVRIERYVPQAALLPRCAAVISHGGSGTVMGAVLHGLAQVVVPLGADQPHNADRCRTLGLGVVLDPIALRADDVRRAVSDVVVDPGYREAAARLAAEAAELPGPAHAVALLERLAVERAPVTAG